MSILFILIPLSLVLLAIAAAAFIWAVNDGQFDDLETPALRILLEHDDAAPAATGPEEKQRPC